VKKHKPLAKDLDEFA